MGVYWEGIPQGGTLEQNALLPILCIETGCIWQVSKTTVDKLWPPAYIYISSVFVRMSALEFDIVVFPQKDVVLASDPHHEQHCQHLI